MYSQLIVPELLIVFFLILINLFFRYRKKNNQYDLTATILIFSLCWAFQIIAITGIPSFHLIGRALSKDRHSYDEAIAITLTIQLGIASMIILIIRLYILKISIMYLLDINNLSRHFKTGLTVSILTFTFLFLINLPEIRQQFKFGDLNLARTDPFPLFIIFTGIVVTGPIIEEIIFRGFLFFSAERSIGKIFALLLSSLGWALFHPNDYFVGTLIFGMILSGLFLKTRSLFPTMMLHISHNLFHMLKWLTIL